MPSKDERAVSKGTDRSENALTIELVANPAHQSIARVTHALDRIHDRRSAAGPGRPCIQVGEVPRDFFVVDAADNQGGYGEKHQSFHFGLRCDGGCITPARPRAQNLEFFVELTILGDLDFSNVKPAARLRPDLKDLGLIRTSVPTSSVRTKQS